MDKKNFYTSIDLSGNLILFRGVEAGKRVSKKINFKPTLYTYSRTPTKFKTLDGKYVEPFTKPIKECREIIASMKDVDGGEICGNERFEYCFIADRYPGKIDWDINLIRIANIDIEVGSENGFPDPKTATEEITAITYKVGGKYYVFGCGDFVIPKLLENTEYFKCANEVELVNKFLNVWIKDYPDIVTGWNNKFFDIPYLYNRITKLFGEKIANKLSPWGRVSERTVVLMNKPQQSYEICGITTYDYMELYRKFAAEGMSQESYKLNHIAHVEINERKISYTEYDSLHMLYKNNFQKFIEYNIHDVTLVDGLDKKLKLIELGVGLAYEAKAQYGDVLTQTRMWDAMIYNHLLEKNIVFPPRETHEKKNAYEGAFVKDPKVGLHNWVASLDLNSEYPKLIEMYNISPETIIEPDDYPKYGIQPEKVNVDIILMQHLCKDLPPNVTITPNGQYFRTDIKGFLAEMMHTLYDERVLYKKKMKEEKKKIEEIQKELEKRNINKGYL